MPRLTDTQLVVLATAARHPNGLVVIPDRLRGAIADRMLARLARLGLIESFGDDGRADLAGMTGHRITDAGLAAIGVETGALEGGAAAAKGIAGDFDLASPPPTPRAGSKLDRVVRLLEQPGGASIEVIAATTDWLPHTARAALTGLRKRGLAVERRLSAGGGSVYVLARR